MTICNVLSAHLLTVRWVAGLFLPEPWRITADRGAGHPLRVLVLVKQLYDRQGISACAIGLPRETAGHKLVAGASRQGVGNTRMEPWYSGMYRGGKRSDPPPVTLGDDTSSS